VVARPQYSGWLAAFGLDAGASGTALLIVPTLCVVTPLGTLRVLLLAGGRDQLKRRVRKRSTQSVEGYIPTRSVGTINQSLAQRGSRGIHAVQPLARRFGRLASLVRLLLLIVPTLCVVTPLGTLCVLLLAGGRDQLKRRVRKRSTQSVEGYIPTRSVGTIKRGQFRRLGFRIPSGGRVEVLWRGAFGMDAKRGTMGQGWPTVTTLGTAPERGKFRVAKPGCRARFLFGYFLFARAKITDCP